MWMKTNTTVFSIYIFLENHLDSPLKSPKVLKYVI